VIEIQTFRLAAGVDEADFLDADKRMQTEFIPNHEGFVRRTTARGADDEWAVVTLWGSAADADRSAELAAAHAAASAFTALIDHTSLVVKRFTELDG
jgi:hypothetical protein